MENISDLIITRYPEIKSIFPPLETLLAALIGRDRSPSACFERTDNAIKEIIRDKEREINPEPNIDDNPLQNPEEVNKKDMSSACTSKVRDKRTRNESTSSEEENDPKKLKELEIPQVDRKVFGSKRVMSSFPDFPLGDFSHQKFKLDEKAALKVKGKPKQATAAFIKALER